MGVHAGDVRPDAREFHGAALIADVSGFTALAERLAARGPEGVEDLSRLVNTWFGAMVDTIASHGGDLVRFAGDAPIAVFPVDGPSDRLGNAVARASQCGAALTDVMRSLRSADTEVNVRVGIGAGLLVAAVAGGVDGRWEFVVGGAPIRDMAAAEKQAGPGEVVLSAGAAAAAAEVSGAPVACVLDAPQLSDDVARAFVPPAALHFLDAGQAVWTAEVTRATVLFLGLGGIALDTAGDAPRLQEALMRLQGPIVDQGGSLMQFLYDDKGLTLVVAWGIAGHRHEDDAVRAARAAAACRRAAETARLPGFSVRGGLATGKVFCGWRGHDGRREYALIGTTVNRAARLMTLERADGRHGPDHDVLADEATAHAAGRAQRFEPAGAVALKGSPAPVPAFGVSEADDGAPPPTGSEAAVAAPDFVGRDSELARLTATWAAVRAGGSGTIVIRGEAGMGKSTLVSLALASARTHGLSVAFGSVEALSTSAPYLPWRRVLATLLGLDDTLSLQARASALVATLSAEGALAAFAPLVAEVVGLPVPDNDLTSRLVQQPRVDKAREVVVALVKARAAATPIAIVLDNLHWMDSLSIGLASALSGVAGLALVLVTRPLQADPPSAAADLVKAPGVQVIDLARLSAEDVRRLIGRRLRVTHVPDDLANAVESRAAGFPLFVGELVRSLVDAGVVSVSGSTCVLADAGARLRHHQFPDSVQGVIADRLDRLGADEQLTLKVASAIGSPVHRAAITAVHPLAPSPAAVDAMLATLTTRGFLLPRGDAFEFGHAVMRDVAYGLMPGDQRRPLHRRIAQWFESHPGSVPAAVMAHHWMEADDGPASLTWLERAGAEASRLGAAREAVQHFRSAFAVAGRSGAPAVEPERRVRWLRTLGHAQSELGAMDDSVRQLTAALDLLGRRLPRTPAAMAGRLVTETLRQVAILAGVLPSRPRRTEAGRARALEEAEVLRLLGKLAFYAQDHLRYLTVSLQAINVAERAAIGPSAASAYAALGYIVAMIGLERLARRWWRLAGESGELDAQLNMLIGRQMYLNSQTRWGESLRVGEEQADLIARLGTSTSLPSHLLIRGYVHLHHGRYDRAAADVGTLLAWCLGAHHLQQAFAAHLQMCGILLEQGQLDEARRHLADADALSHHVADPMFLTIYRGLAVEERLLSNDLAGAKAPADALRAVMRGSSPYFGDMVGYVAMAEYALACCRHAGSDADRRACLREADWAVKTLGKHASLNPYARPRLWLLSGKVASAGGHAGRATRAFRRALALAGSHDMPREAAYAHAALGRHAALSDETRQQHLSEARARFSEMGSPHRLRELDEAAAERQPTA